jgi:glycine/D-amino acid oxidase-like deaminating enzyme
MPSPDGRSLWADTLPDHERFAGTPLTADIDADVAIVGAGLTGLWTAVHLLRRDPSMRVVVIERESVGFGASGRNGGWCSALLPMSLVGIAEHHGDGAARRMQQAMHDTVADVVAFAAAAGPGIAERGGTISLARNRPQLERLDARAAEMRRFGFGDDYVRLDATETARECNATQLLGGLYTPHCATVHPLRLTHAVARAASSAGACIHEGTTALQIEPGRITTGAGVVTADVVVRATEGYTAQLPGQRRSMLPIYSLMIATEPVPPGTWEAIGLERRPTFHDRRNMIIYGQRTADGRIAFGGRGAPYHFGSSIRPEYDTDGRVKELLTEALRDLFPALGGTAVTHHWGGALGAARDWNCSARFDRRTGLASAGGYVGDGVATTHLAGRTLAALITGSVRDGDDEIVQLPWVGHRSRTWEPEPLRWLGVNAARVSAARADAVELRTGRRSRLWGGIVETLLEH